MGFFGCMRELTGLMVGLKPGQLIDLVRRSTGLHRCF